MDRLEPSPEDVVWVNPSENLIANISTCRINQLKHTVRERLKGLSNAAPTWLEEGIDCQFLDAQAGGGWKKGKIRLRVEIVLDEPEPEPEPEPIPEPLDPDSNFLDSLRKDISPEQ